MRTNYILQKHASNFRSKWDIGSKDPIPFKSLLLKLNIVAVFRRLSGNFSGMSFKSNDAKFMLINSEHPIGRQNFTICHEIYHLCIQQDFDYHPCSTGNFVIKNKHEYDADSYAAYLLLPGDGIIDLIPDNELRKNAIELPTIFKIEQYFGCSRTALLHRLHSLNLLDFKKYEDYKNNASNDARLYGYNDKLYKPGRHNLVIGDYGIIAKELYDAEKISESHYVNLMRDIGFDIDLADSQNEQSC